MKAVRIIMGSALALTMAAAAGAGALAEDRNVVAVSGGSARTDVLISSSYTAETVTDPGAGKITEVKKYDAPVFCVTLPASLPLTINADGTVTTPSNLKIENGSAGPVKVSNVEFFDGSDWSLMPYSSDFDAMKVGSYKLGLSLTANGVEVKTGDAGEALRRSWTIAKNDALPITAAASASAVSNTVTENNAATIVFTVAWDAAE